MLTPADFFRTEAIDSAAIMCDILKLYSKRTPIEEISKRLELSETHIEEFIETRASFHKKRFKRAQKIVVECYAAA